MADTTNLDWLISVDDHVLEPHDVWQRWVPSKYKENAPRMESDATDDFWVYDGNRIPTSGLFAAAGKSKKEFTPEPIRYADMRPACYDSAARVKDMDEAGILASQCFPSFPRFCGQVFLEGSDKDLGLACVEAYNNWMIDEWCGSAPGRFIPMTLIPLWAPELAAKEIRRCAAKGAKAIAFSENPTRLGLPSIYDANGFWDPVWQACDETGVVVSMHIGSSSYTYTTSPVSPALIGVILGPLVAQAGAMVDWLFAPPFQKYENLKITLAEGNVGWMPYVLEKCQYTVDQQGAWIGSFDLGEGADLNAHTERNQQIAALPDLIGYNVAEIFRKHIFGCFISDFHGMRNIREIGVENVMIETDYPHSDSTWPNCVDFAKKQLAATDLSDDDKYLVLRGNAERVFNFTPAQV